MLGNLNDKAVSFDREQLVSFTFGARLARRILGDTAFFQKLIQTFSLSLNFSDGHRAAIVLQFPTHRLAMNDAACNFLPAPRYYSPHCPPRPRTTPTFAALRFPWIKFKKKRKNLGKEGSLTEGRKESN